MSDEPNKELTDIIGCVSAEYYYALKKKICSSRRDAVVGALEIAVDNSIRSREISTIHVLKKLK
jgi:hypothetical protein